MCLVLHAPVYLQNVIHITVKILITKNNISLVCMMKNTRKIQVSFKNRGALLSRDVK